MIGLIKRLMPVKTCGMFAVNEWVFRGMRSAICYEADIAENLVTRQAGDPRGSKSIRRLRDNVHFVSDQYKSCATFEVLELTNL
jgi:hypothetical protein